VKAQANIPPRTDVKVVVRADPALVPLFEGAKTEICRLGNVADFSASATAARPGQCLVDVGRGYEAYIPAAGLIDVAKEKQRLVGEVTRLEKIVGGIAAKLGNASFVDRAPEDVVAQTKAQHENLSAQLRSLKQNLDALS
jgi:valyl-tRNA synthetase